MQQRMHIQKFQRLHRWKKLKTLSSVCSLVENICFFFYIYILQVSYFRIIEWNIAAWRSCQFGIRKGASGWLTRLVNSFVHWVLLLYREKGYSQNIGLKVSGLFYRQGQHVILRLRSTEKSLREKNFLYSLIYWENEILKTQINH